MTPLKDIIEEIRNFGIDIEHKLEECGSGWVNYITINKTTIFTHGDNKVVTQYLIAWYQGYQYRVYMMKRQ